MQCKCLLLTQSGHERWSSGPSFKVAFVVSGDQLHVGCPENLQRMAFGSYSVLATRKPLPPYRLTGRTALRSAERTSCGLSYQEPPRITRRHEGTSDVARPSAGASA